MRAERGLAQYHRRRLPPGAAQLLPRAPPRAHLFRPREDQLLIIMPPRHPKHAAIMATLFFKPGGLSDISRGWSEAEPPETKRKSHNPGGVAEKVENMRVS